MVISRAKSSVSRTLLFVIAWVAGVGCLIPTPGTEPVPDAGIDASHDRASLGDATADMGADGAPSPDTGTVANTDAEAGPTGDEVASGNPSVTCVRRIFGPARQLLLDVAVAADGRIAVVGVILDTTDGAQPTWTDFGNGPVPIGGGRSAFIAVYDRSCGYLWSRVLGPFPESGSPLTLQHVVFDASGNIVVAGVITRPVDFGAGVLTPVGNLYDIVVAKYDPAYNLVFAKRFGDVKPDVPDGLGVDGDGNIYIAGTFGIVDFGGEPLYAQLGLGYAGGEYLAKLTPAGAHVFSKSFPIPSPGTGLSRGQFILRSFHVSAAGDITLVGSGPEGASIGFGGPAVTFPTRFVWAARLTNTGAHVWSRAVSSPTPRGAVLANGDVAITTGGTEGITDFGNGPVPGLFAVGRLSSATGAAVWSRGAQPLAGPRGFQSKVVGTATGGMLLAVDLSGTLDLGCGPHTEIPYDTAAYSSDILLARLNSAGQCVYSMRFGDKYLQRAKGVAVTPTGNSVLVGEYHGSITFGATTLANYAAPSSAGPDEDGEDAFIAVFSK